MKTNDRPLTDLMNAVDSGAAQLPDFQRGWVWDDGRIKALILSVIHNFPVGAAMFLEYGNESIHFKHNPIEGSAANPNIEPDELILDGQQRLTSLYNALFSKNPVHTKTDKGKEIDRYYYINIENALDPNADDDDVIISIPATKQIVSDFGRKIEKDLSTKQDEFREKSFPLNIILDPGAEQGWQNEYYAYYNYDPAVIQQFTAFFSKIIMPTQKYAMPVILLDKETPKEAVCQVFENVNTGGVSLTVFELVTAIFAMDNFPLRENWQERKEQYFSGDLLNVITSTDFLTALTLLSTYKRKLVDDKVAVSCKKKDVLNLTLSEYKKYNEDLTKGFVEAEKILQEERVFFSRDLPYTTQLIPLAAICTVLLDGNQIKVTNIKNKIKQWYWCGVFGEMYGGANETRFAYDIVQVLDWVEDDTQIPRTCMDSYFNPTRLLGLQSRQSAAYKGIMALILKNHSQDFISGREMDFAVYKAEYIDIHHIFPRAFCEENKLPKLKWNSVVNKTPISYSTNREIGGVAPSKYLERIEKKGQVFPSTLDAYLETHWIDASLARADNFDQFIIERAKKLLDAIQNATGRTITGRDSEDVIAAFGDKLI